MSELDNRLESIRGHVKDAHDELHALGEEERKPYRTELKRLDEVIAYSAVVLEATQADLVSTTTFQTIQAAASQISTQPLTALQNAEAYGDALLNAVALLPVARGREVEQQVKDAAANFQRSATHRLNSLKEEIGSAREDITALSPAIEERSAEIKTAIEAQAAAFETRLAELEATGTTQRQSVDEQMTRQSSTFTETQEERSAEFQEALEKFRSQLTEVQQLAQQELEERVAEIRRMEEESAQLVGAIGLAGTAERYSEEAKAQRMVANRLRVSVIVLALAAVGMAFYASLHHEQPVQNVTAKLAVSAILGGVAAYLARQSGRHRHREEHARSLQLELTAFSPFIEPLSAEQQEEERVIMTRKTFGKTTAVEASEEEPGPTAVSFLLQRRRKELQERAAGSTTQ